ncbi:12694_t:CDS:2 [Funneliformis mosseae]|uniref:12694_t:CDS:1 n=1 Tax=Funneliformis mosseae TaxID=27381 RepID=A0A9N8W6Y9_FUNMO|nr:12694_t:CDS:2 [Funneliformis mosseae]
MSGSKANLNTILDQSYRECHDIILNSLKNDLQTLYSCIRVSRSFCRTFIPILWMNPFKFVKDEDRLVQIFNTLIHCLDQTWLVRQSIEIEQLLTPKAYFKYHTFIKEFELNTLQKAMRIWISIHLSNRNDLFRMSSERSRVSKLVFMINKCIGDLFFNKGGQYDSLNLFYNDFLSAILDISEFKNHKESLANVKKLSLGLFNSNGMELITPIAENFLKLQTAFSPNIQHLQILSINNSIRPNEFSRNLIDFIHTQRHLKSLLIHDFWKDEFEPFLKALRKHAKSLTFFKLECPILFTTHLSSMLRSLPNLITLELKFTPIPDGDASREISAASFSNLEHLNYDCCLSYHSTNHITLFKKILLSANHLKSLRVDDTYCLFIKEIQGQCFLNLTHFHLILHRSCAIMDSMSLVDLMELLRNLHQLIHLKLNTVLNRYRLLNRIESFKRFSQVLACSLKILEVNFPVSDEYLEVLFNESKFNLHCIKLYCYERTQDISLRVFIDYAKRNERFKELGITKEFKFSKELIEEARNRFNILIHTNSEINSPFYDVPIKDSYWCNRR